MHQIKRIAWFSNRLKPLCESVNLGDESDWLNPEPGWESQIFRTLCKSDLHSLYTINSETDKNDRKVSTIERNAGRERWILTVVRNIIKWKSHRESLEGSNNVYIKFANWLKVEKKIRYSYEKWEFRALRLGKLNSAWVNYQAQCRWLLMI